MRSLKQDLATTYSNSHAPEKTCSWSLLGTSFFLLFVGVKTQKSWSYQEDTWIGNWAVFVTWTKLTRHWLDRQKTWIQNCGDGFFQNVSFPTVQKNTFFIIIWSRIPPLSGASSCPLNGVRGPFHDGSPAKARILQSCYVSAANTRYKMQKLGLVHRTETIPGWTTSMEDMPVCPRWILHSSCFSTSCERSLLSYSRWSLMAIFLRRLRLVTRFLSAPTPVDGWVDEFQRIITTTWRQSREACSIQLQIRFTLAQLTTDECALSLQ